MLCVFSLIAHKIKFCYSTYYVHIQYLNSNNCIPQIQSINIKEYSLWFKNTIYNDKYIHKLVTSSLFIFLILPSSWSIKNLLMSGCLAVANLYNFFLAHPIYQFGWTFTEHHWLNILSYYKTSLMLIYILNITDLNLNHLRTLESIFENKFAF